MKYSVLLMDVVVTDSGPKNVGSGRGQEDQGKLRMEGKGVFLKLVERSGH